MKSGFERSSSRSRLNAACAGATAAALPARACSNVCAACTKRVVTSAFGVLEPAAGTCDATLSQDTNAKTPSSGRDAISDPRNPKPIRTVAAGDRSGCDYNVSMEQIEPAPPDTTLSDH